MKKIHNKSIMNEIEKSILLGKYEKPITLKADQ